MATGCLHCRLRYKGVGNDPGLSALRPMKTICVGFEIFDFDFLYFFYNTQEYHSGYLLRLHKRRVLSVMKNQVLIKVLSHVLFCPVFVDIDVINNRIAESALSFFFYFFELLLSSPRSG